MTPANVEALCSASTSGRQLKQYALWNLKKVTRFATGEHYPGIRAALLLAAHLDPGPYGRPLFERPVPYPLPAS